MKPDEIIDKLWENCGHGTRRVDVVDIWLAAANYENNNKLERLRDEFAKEALKIVKDEGWEEASNIGRRCYEIADEMLKARSKS